jgi:hypothetical protein
MTKQTALAVAGLVARGRRLPAARREDLKTILAELESLGNKPVRER